MSNGKQNPEVQGAYVSEINAAGDFFTLLIASADYDTGHIDGQYGKNSAPTLTLGKSGYHRLEATDESSFTFDLIEHTCILLAKDRKYKQLIGLMTNVQSKESVRVVFNRS